MLGVHLMMEMGRRAQPDHNLWKPHTAMLAREARVLLLTLRDKP